MGSFSTAIACHKEGRNFIGTELDPKWHKLGTEKLKNIQMQPTVFQSEQTDTETQQTLF